MSRWLTKRVGLVALAVVVMAVPMLAGCGGEASTLPEVVIGYESDFTGPAQSALVPVYAGFADYIGMANDEEMVPGAKIKVVKYDHRTDYSRIPIGYVWLKGQGVQACFYPSPTDIEMLSDKHVEDQIVAFGTTCLESLRGREWTFFLTETQQHEAQTCMKWVMDTWNYDEGKPKIGLVGHSGALPTEAHLDGVTTILEANPDKFDWVGSQAAPMGTTAWAVEAMALMECDYIMPVTYGSSTGTFIREIRARGYTGSLLATSLAFPGYWNIIRSIVPEDDLFGCYHSHWMPWVGDNAFATDWKAAITEYRAADFAEIEGQQASYGTGWAWGILLTDIIKRAVEEVGADAVDGAAIREAAMSTSLDLTASGWGNPWELSADDNICAATSEMHEWDVDDQVWVNISDPIVV